jgi:DNA-binding transcriptional LysR family regulator
MSLVAAGRFVTILPASALNFSAMRREIKVLPVHLPKARAPSGIVTLKTRAVSPIAQLFIHCAREVAKTSGKRK